MLSVNVKMKLSSREWHFAFGTAAQFIGLEGLSGVGKSTLLRVLAGLERNAKGLVLFRGETWLDSAVHLTVPPWARAVGWMPQEALCFPHLSVYENLTFAGKTGRAEAEDVAEALGIAPLLKRRIRHLSGGERQRVSLGRALLSRPRLLLLDEPFSAVDPVRRRDLIRFVRARALEYQTRVVIVSHRDEELSEIEAERWTLADGGGVVRS